MIEQRSKFASIHRLGRASILATLALSMALALAGSASAYQAERAVLVIIDGLRYTEGMGDPTHANVPNMAALAQQGAIVEPFRNDGLTYTSRAIPAIWCGGWTDMIYFSDPDCGGESNSYSEMPTLFEYYRKQLARPAEDCVYVLKNLCPWKASFDPDYGPDYWPLYHHVGSTDLQVWYQALDVLESSSPHFMLLYLADVDHAGHSGSWSAYISAIATADYIVGELWDYLETDPAYAGKTTLLVTNDHGRHTTDWTGHGDGCEGCRLIQLLAMGPDVHPGLVSSVQRTMCDVAPTLGALLGFETEDATGSFMAELFQPDSSADEPLPGTPVLAIASATNPVRPGTELLLHLPAAGPARLGVFDVTGARVALPFAGSAPSTAFRVAWDARGSDGRMLPGGVYFLRLETSGESATQRVVLTR
jgi:hypothetical protein